MDNKLRFGNFTSSSISALMSLSKDKKDFGKPAITYIKEKLMDTSDIYTTYVCDMCGLFAQRVVKPRSPVYSTDKDIYYCPACNNKTNISKIVIPYAFKLLVQELMSMCIAPRIHTQNDKYTS